MYACIHQTSMHIFIHTYEHTRTHTKEGVRVVSDYQHMYFILQGRINKNRYFIFTGSYFFCRGCCQVRSGHHYVEMSSLQQTNVWWETPPTGATVWVVSHNTWHQYQLYPQTTLDLKLHKVIRRKILFPQTAEWQVEIAKEWECGPAVVQYL